MHTLENHKSAGPIVFASLILLCWLAPAGAAAEGSCGKAAQIGAAVKADLGATLRLFADEKPTHLLVETEQPGLVSLEVAPTTGAKISLVEGGCGGRLGRDVVRIEAAATHLAVAVLRPGRFYVELEAGPTTDRYKLTTTFLPVEIRERVLEPDTFRIRETALYPVVDAAEMTGIEPIATLLAILEGGDPKARIVLALGESRQKAEDHEVDPDPWAKAEDHEVDPDPWAKAEDHEVDPDPWAKDENLSEGPMLLLDFDRGCAGSRADDHADTFACATAIKLGSRVSAELANGWGDDEDVYRFRVGAERATGIAIVDEAWGEAAAAVLFDEAGRELATADGGLLVRTLPAGEYFVRVSGVSGPYELLFE